MLGTRRGTLPPKEGGAPPWEGTAGAASPRRRCRRGAHPAGPQPPSLERRLLLLAIDALLRPRPERAELPAPPLDARGDARGRRRLRGRAGQLRRGPAHGGELWGADGLHGRAGSGGGGQVEHRRERRDAVSGGRAAVAVVREAAACAQKRNRSRSAAYGRLCRISGAHHTAEPRRWDALASPRKESRTPAFQVMLRSAISATFTAREATMSMHARVCSGCGTREARGCRIRQLGQQALRIWRDSLSGSGCPRAAAALPPSQLTAGGYQVQLSRTRQQPPLGKDATARTLR